MLISHRRRFVFIHIPKTGGSSIEKALLPYARWQERMCLQFWPTRKTIAAVNLAMGWTGNGYKQWTGIHKHARAHVIRSAMPRGLFEKYFRFTVVRNPFDRMVSEFFYRLSLPLEPGSGHDPAGTNSLIHRFRAFVRHAVDGPVLPMLSFLQDPHSGALLVNDFLRLETIEADFQRIQHLIGLPMLHPIPHTNSSLVRPSVPLQAWYDRPATLQVIDRYAEDFKQFGYSTDLSSSAYRHF